MKPWLVMLVLSPLLSAPAFNEGTAHAAGAPQQRSERGHLPDLKLSHEPADRAGPASAFTVLPGTGLLSNSALGLGVIRANPKLPDDRLYGRVAPSRSAAVKFRLKF